MQRYIGQTAVLGITGNRLQFPFCSCSFSCSASHWQSRCRVMTSRLFSTLLLTAARPTCRPSRCLPRLQQAHHLWRQSKHTSNARRLWAAAGGLLGATGGLGLMVYFAKPRQTVACAGKTKAGEAIKGLPEYLLEEISKHKSKETGVWVTYGDGVYDISEFAAQHPGGSEKIMLAAGAALEPFWAVFAQHNTEEVYEMLEELRIGNVAVADRGKTATAVKKEGPYANDPTRSPILKINTQEPFNAETPTVLLAESYLTPNDLFFVRNHLPVPTVDPDSYVLEVKGEGAEPVRLTLEDLKTKFPKRKVTATIQCAGNRRADLAKVKPVKGLSWTGGAIGNAEWGGVLLRDVLLFAGHHEEQSKAEHVHLEGLDKNPLTGECYGASVPIDKAMDPRGDCLLAYEMNGAEISRDHGYPLRAVIPGTVGARNVKWVSHIQTSEAEYGGFWQQRDYKGFSPSINWDNVDFSSAPAIQELPVQSLICSPQDGSSVQEGEEEIGLKGIAWSGGGRPIVRVDISADGGKTWHIADLAEGKEQRRRRAWGWTLWEASVPLPREQREVEICCKAVDLSYNVQPDTVAPIWNLRGCLSNAWHRIRVKVH